MLFRPVRITTTLPLIVTDDAVSLLFKDLVDISFQGFAKDLWKILFFEYVKKKTVFNIERPIVKFSYYSIVSIVSRFLEGKWIMA